MTFQCRPRAFQTCCYGNPHMAPGEGPFWPVAPIWRWLDPQIEASVLNSLRCHSEVGAPRRVGTTPGWWGVLIGTPAAQVPSEAPHCPERPSSGSPTRKHRGFGCCGLPSASDFQGTETLKCPQQRPQGEHPEAVRAGDLRGPSQDAGWAVQSKIPENLGLPRHPRVWGLPSPPAGPTWHPPAVPVSGSHTLLNRRKCPGEGSVGLAVTQESCPAPTGGGLAFPEPPEPTPPICEAEAPGQLRGRRGAGGGCEQSLRQAQDPHSNGTQHSRSRQWPRRWGSNVPGSRARACEPGAWLSGIPGIGSTGWRAGQEGGGTARKRPGCVGTVTATLEQGRCLAAVPTGQRAP